MLGDLFGNGVPANHVPRLGRRSLSPFRSSQTGFRFYGGQTGTGDRAKLAGFFGPLFDRYENFRYYGGRPGEELARGLLRNKRMDEEYSDLMQLPKNSDNVKMPVDTAASNAAIGKADKEGNINAGEDQDEYWQNVLSEATINTVLQKMAEIGETREMIEAFNKYEKYGVGNPLPRYLASVHHPIPPQVKVKSTYPKTNEGILSKYRSYLPFPRRKKKRRSNVY